MNNLLTCPKKPKNFFFIKKNNSQKTFDSIKKKKYSILDSPYQNHSFKKRNTSNHKNKKFVNFLKTLEKKKKRLNLKKKPFLPKEENINHIFKTMLTENKRKNSPNFFFKKNYQKKKYNLQKLNRGIKLQLEFCRKLRILGKPKNQINFKMKNILFSKKIKFYNIENKESCSMTKISKKELIIIGGKSHKIFKDTHIFNIQNFSLKKKKK